MKDPKDIEKLFADSDEQLTQRPPTRAWDKLSAKLDQAESTVPPTKVVPLTRRFPAWQVAASVLVLVGLFTFATRQIDTNNYAKAADASGQIFLEDIPMEEDVTGFYALAVKCTQFYNISPSALVAERARGTSRLRLSERTNRYAGNDTGFESSGNEASSVIAATTATAPTEMNATTAESPAATIVPIAMADGNSKANAELLNNGVPTDHEQYEYAEVAVMDDVVSADLGDAKTTQAQAIETQASAPATMDIDVDTEAEKLYAKSEARAAKDVGVKEMKKRKADETIALNAASNVISYTEEDLFLGLGDISSFQWLIGQWEAQSDQQQVKQKWRQKDQFTLEGSAVFSINGQEIQVQKMEIRKGENGIYFILANLADNTTQKYQLKSMEAYEAIFAGKDNQEEFIIQQLDNDQFNNFSNQIESQSILKNNATPFNNLNFSRVNKQ